MSGRSSPPPSTPIATIGNSDHELVDLLESSQWPAEKKAYPRVREVIETLHRRMVDLGSWEDHKRFLEVEALDEGVLLREKKTEKPLRKKTEISPAWASLRDKHVSDRRKVIADMLFSGKKRPSTSTICGKLDYFEVPVPEEWTEKYGVKNWLEADKDSRIRPRLQAMISKDIRLIREASRESSGN